MKNNFYERANSLLEEIHKDILKKMYNFSYPSKIIYFYELQKIDKNIFKTGLNLKMKYFDSAYNISINEIYGFIGRNDRYELILCLSEERYNFLKSSDKSTIYINNYINWNFIPLYDYDIEKNNKKFISIESNYFTVLNDILNYYLVLNDVITKYVILHQERYIYNYDILIKGISYRVKIDCPEFKKEEYENGLSYDFFLNDKINKYINDFINDNIQNVMTINYKNSIISFSKKK